MSPTRIGLTSWNIPYHPYKSLRDEADVPIFHGRNQNWGSQVFSHWSKVTQRGNGEPGVTPAWEGSRMESLLLLLLTIP